MVRAMDTPKVTTTKRGIFARQQFDIADAWKNDRKKAIEFLKAAFPAGHDTFVKDHIGRLIEAATDVLKRAGHPSEAGCYVEKADGNLEHVIDAHAALKQLKAGEALRQWPYFLKREPLSAEDYAIGLIHNARGLLGVVERAEPPWAIASMALYFAEAQFKFLLSAGPMATIADRGVKAIDAGVKGTKSMQAQAAHRVREIEMLAAEYLSRPGTSKKRGAFTIATAIHPLVSERIGRRASVETIRQDILKLRKLGRLS